MIMNKPLPEAHSNNKKIIGDEKSEVLRNKTYDH